MSRSRSEDGFSLVELMVVVLIVAILIAIGVVSLVGARTRSQDRATQSEVRNVHTVQRIYYAGEQEFTDDIDELKAVDSAYAYTTNLTAMVGNGEVIYVDVVDTTPDTVLVAGRSNSGKCFWLRATPSESQRFATNSCGGLPTSWADNW